MNSVLMADISELDSSKNVIFCSRLGLGYQLNVVDRASHPLASRHNRTPARSTWKKHNTQPASLPSISASCSSFQLLCAASGSESFIVIYRLDHKNMNDVRLNARVWVDLYFLFCSIAASTKNNIITSMSYN